MLEKDLVILGSCVTRDPLTGSDLERRLKYYHCRSNLCSMANTVPLNRELTFSGKFGSRNVQEDLDKTTDYDHQNCVVVFDFIDDRFPVGKIGDAVFTLNPQAKFQSPNTYAGAEVIRHFDLENRDMVKGALKKFAETRRRLFSENKIVLHEVFLNTHYEGKVMDRARLAFFNDYFRFLYDQILEVWKVDYVIGANETLTSSEATPLDHQWGHAPFHFFNGYNLNIQNQLSGIMLR